METKRKAVANKSLTVNKALTILPILTLEKGGMGMMELSKRIGLNRSTVYRLVSALMESGFIRQDPVTQKYSLGLKIVELAGHILAEMDVREIARAHLQKLARLSGETIHLSIMNKDGAAGYEIVYIDKVEGAEAVGLLTQVGKSFPAYLTAMGKAILAYLPKDELDEMLARQHFEARTKYTIVNKQELIEHLKIVRALGYAVDNEENRLTARCIGSPIFDATGEVVAAVSISGPAFRMTLKRLKTLSKPLKVTAMDISRGLGYIPAATASRDAVP